MAISANQLYELLPAIYRQRDYEQGGPLRQLLGVVAEQIAVVQENIDQSYDDLFIETCAEWVVPYIADLIGARLLDTRASGGLSQRAQVANTLALRRRKGTLAVIEEIASAVTEYSAVVVEEFRRLAMTPSTIHPRPESFATLSLRDPLALERIDTAFDRVSHSAEVRRAASGRGRYNIPNIGIHLFTLRSFPLTQSAARHASGHQWFINPLGIDTPLFSKPVTESGVTALAERENVPSPITRLDFKFGKSTYYGPGNSIVLNINGADVGAGDVVLCNLSGPPNGVWAHAPSDKYGIDPVLGRLATPTNSAVPRDVLVSWYYGAPDAIGGGEYERGAAIAGTPTAVVNRDAPEVQQVLNDTAGGGIIEIEDSFTYSLPSSSPNLDIAANASVELRAARGRRPLVEITGGDLVIRGAAGSSLTLNGVVISGGGGVVIRGGLTSVKMLDCTLVPRSGQPSLTIENDNVSLTMQRCITGSIRVARGSTASLERCIVDASEPGNVAYSGVDTAQAGGALSLKECTVIGRIHAVSLPEVTDTIAYAAGTVPVRAERTQTGCVRYSYIPWGSQAPRRYRCRPESATDAARIYVQFVSRVYGTPAYCQLSRATSIEIRRGASDESEMGVYHDVFAPQRDASLRQRLQEFLRHGLEAGVYYET